MSVCVCFIFFSSSYFLPSSIVSKSFESGAKMRERGGEMVCVCVWVLLIVSVLLSWFVVFSFLLPPLAEFVYICDARRHKAHHIFSFRFLLHLLLICWFCYFHQFTQMDRQFSIRSWRKGNNVCWERSLSHRRGQQRQNEWNCTNNNIHQQQEESALIDTHQKQQFTLIIGLE